MNRIILLRRGPVHTVSLRCPASLTDLPTLPVSAFATVLLTHVQSFGQFDEILYIVEKTSALTLPEFQPSPFDSVATSCRNASLSS